MNPQIQIPEVNLDSLLEVYLNNYKQLDVSQLINLAELYCIMDPSLYLNKKNLKNIISQILEDLKRTIPNRHPDDNIQLLNELSSLQKVLPFELETISYDTWVEMAKVMNLFEKNIISMFHLISHKKPLLRLSTYWGFLLRDKFFYKMHELIDEKQHTLHPQEILELCITLSRRDLLDSETMSSFQRMFNQEGVLNLLSQRQLIQVLELDTEFEFLAKETLMWILETQSDSFLDLQNLPELMDLYVALKRHTLSNKQLSLEKSIKAFLEEFNSRNAVLNQKIARDNLCEEINFFRNENVLFEQFQRILKIYKQNHFSHEMFNNKFSLVLKILVKGWALVEVKSETKLVNIKHDILCLGEPYASLIDMFNS